LWIYRIHSYFDCDFWVILSVRSCRSLTRGCIKCFFWVKIFVCVHWTLNKKKWKKNFFKPDKFSFKNPGFFQFWSILLQIVEWMLYYRHPVGMSYLNVQLPALYSSYFLLIFFQIIMFAVMPPSRHLVLYLFEIVKANLHVYSISTLVYQFVHLIFTLLRFWSRCGLFSDCWHAYFSEKFETLIIFTFCSCCFYF